jgi:hypothetical protein
MIASTSLPAPSELSAVTSVAGGESSGFLRPVDKLLALWFFDSVNWREFAG